MTPGILERKKCPLCARLVRADADGAAAFSCSLGKLPEDCDSWDDTSERETEESLKRWAQWAVAMDSWMAAHEGTMDRVSDVSDWLSVEAFSKFRKADGKTRDKLSALLGKSITMGMMLWDTGATEPPDLSGDGIAKELLTVHGGCTCLKCTGMTLLCKEMGIEPKPDRGAKMMDDIKNALKEILGERGVDVEEILKVGFGRSDGSDIEEFEER